MQFQIHFPVQLSSLCLFCAVGIFFRKADMRLS